MVLHSWYQSKSVHMTKFCDIDCSLVCDECMNNVDSMFLLMVVYSCVDKWLKEMIVQLLLV